MKHTPGKWHFDGHGINADGIRITKLSQDPWIYNSGKPIRNEVFEANGNLIAAAPDLLEACRLALGCFANLSTNANNGIGIFAGSATEALQNAIAKAEGK